MRREITLGYLTTGSHLGESKRIRAILFANKTGAELYYIIASSGKSRRPHIIQKGDIFTVDEPRNKNNGDVIHFITPYHVEYSNQLGEVFGSHVIASDTTENLDKVIEEMYKKRSYKIKITAARRSGKRENKD